MSRSRKKIWNSKEEQFLVELWAERVEQLHGKGVRETLPVYEDIQSELAERRCRLTIEEIRNKVHNFKSKYRKIRIDMEQTGNATDWSMFYKIDKFLRKYEMESVLGKFEIHNMDADAEEAYDGSEFERTYNSDTSKRHSRKKRIWSIEEETFLVERWADRFEELKYAKVNKQIYKDIQNIFLETMDCRITLLDLKSKIQSFINRYEKEKMNIERGFRKSKWPFYEKIYKMLEKPQGTSRYNSRSMEMKDKKYFYVSESLSENEENNTVISENALDLEDEILRQQSHMDNYKVSYPDADSTNDNDIEDSLREHNTKSDVVKKQLKRKLNKSNSDSDQVHKKRRYKQKSFWYADDVKLLVKSWRKRAEDLRRYKYKDPIYQELRRELVKQKCFFSIDEVKNKMNHLLGRIKKERKVLLESGSQTSTWPLYDDINSIFEIYDSVQQSELTTVYIPKDSVKIKTEDENDFSVSESLCGHEENNTVFYEDAFDMDEMLSQQSHNSEVNYSEAEVANEQETENSLSEYSTKSDCVQKQPSRKLNEFNANADQVRQKRQYKQKNFWFSNDEKLLVKAWRKRAVDLRRFKHNYPVYEEIITELAEQKCFFSLNEVKSKMHNLMSKLKKERQMLLETGSQTSSWPLYDEINSILEINDSVEQSEFTTVYTPKDSSRMKTEDEKNFNMSEILSEDVENNTVFCEEEMLSQQSYNSKANYTEVEVVIEKDMEDCLSEYSTKSDDVQKQATRKLNKVDADSEQVREKRKYKPKNFWFPNDEKLLVKAWMKRAVKLRRLKHNLAVYEQIISELAEQNCFFNIDEVKNKMHSLMIRLKRERQVLLNTGRTKSKWPLYDDVNSIHEIIEHVEQLQLKKIYTPKQPFKKRNWTHDEEILLLKEWNKRIKEQQNLKYKIPVHSKIQLELRQNNFERSVDEIGTKIHNLTTEYNYEKSLNGHQSTWPLYCEIHKILGKHTSGDESKEEDNDILCENTTLETNDANHQHLCRVCMQNEPLSDWNKKLPEFPDVSYKDCYYRYTHLPFTDLDTFPQLLCDSCLTDMQNIHAFIEKALKAHDAFEQNLIARENSTEINKDLALQEDERTTDIEDDCFYIEELDIHCEEVEIQTNAVQQELDKSQQKNEKQTNDMYVVKKKYPIQQKNTAMLKNIKKGTSQTPTENKTNVTGHQTNLRPDSLMCSYCSKILIGISRLKKHEKTHLENREYEAECPKCGLKLLNRSYLRAHILLHNKNRKKKFNCDFCDKVFCTSGSRNIHRRIHLGQMVKYVIHCKECNIDIKSTNFKAHQAAHRNEPQVRCTLCDKDFFGILSLHRHMRAVHKRKKGSFEEITHYYETERTRLSHALLKQKYDVKPKFP